MLIYKLIIINIIVDNNKISVKFSECRGGIFYEIAKNVVFSSVSVVDKYSKLSTGYVEKWWIE